MRKISTFIIIIIVIVATIIVKFNYKKIKFGNNINIKSAEEIAQYILDINSYEAKEEITIESNKNINKYIVKEKCSKEKNIYKKEVLEPCNLEGITITYNGTNLEIKNSTLGLKKIYENYSYIGDSNTSIFDFINDYNNSQTKKIEETDEEIILTVKIKEENIYRAYKKMYISKRTGNPNKMIIQNKSQKEVIYILYNEIKINNLQKEDVLAFKLK